VSIFGYVIANVSSLMNAFDQSENSKSDQLSSIREYLKEKNCPANISKEVTNHYKHLFSHSSGLNEEDIMNRLPPNIRKDILLIKHKKEMSLIPIFNYINNHSIKLYLFSKMSPYFFDVDQFLSIEGEHSDGILFIVKGSASAIKKLRTVENTYKGFNQYDSLSDYYKGDLTELISMDQDLFSQNFLRTSTEDYIELPIRRFCSK
jgi:voltage-gated potassium channel